MGRKRSQKRTEAEKIWLNSGGKKPLIDIAAELGVKDTQIRKWKCEDKWEQKLKGTLPKESKKKKSNVTNKKRNQKQPREVLPKIKIDNPELTEKQRLFCLYYVKYWNAGKAAKKAQYECSYQNGFYEIGCQLLKKPQVKNEIDRLKQNIVDGIGVEVMAVLQKYIDIAFADITDFLSFGRRDVQVMGPFGPIYEGKGKNKKPIMKTVNYVDLKESDQIDGTIISEVKQGREGVSIKLCDKMEAFKKLEQYFDLLPDKHKRMIEEARLEMDKQKLGIKREELELHKKEIESKAW